MIFISYNHNDSELVKDIANKIATVFGQNNVFFDEWSIKPGDGIIDKMNSGLEDSSHFFFFMSKNSLTSEMVKLEWQNALWLKTKKQLVFVPVKIDDCSVPAILLQNLYIDIYGKGLEIGIRQIIDLIAGNAATIEMGSGFQNVRAEVCSENGNRKMNVQIYVKSIFEPQARFLVLYGNPKDQVKFKFLSDSGLFVKSLDNVTTSDNISHSAYRFALMRGISPGFPIRFEMVSDFPIDLHGILRAKNEDDYEGIPVLQI